METCGLRHKCHLYDFSSIRTSDEKTSQFIQKLLKGAVRYNTEFLNNWNGFKVINRLDFPREWGLGSSSTVIHNMAQWADINPFHLHFYVSDGSGYDIACAGADGPLVYQVTDDELSYTEIDFEPNYLKKVHFVYLGNKQSSSDGIIHYTKKVKERKRIAAAVTKLTNSALACDNLDDFMTIMNDHEDIMSAALQLPKIKQERFSSFHGAIKSLGAWGGDFAMVASEMSASEVQAYFKGRGCNKIISYQEMLLPEKVEEAVGV